ncbi:gall11 coactivator, partial [Fusarium albosuccineum]
MQHMAGAGQMMQQQQMRKANNTQLQQVVYQNLVQHTQPFTTISWQSNVSILDRMGKTMNLITNIALAMNGFDYIKSAEYGCQFERETFHNSPTKEAYEQEMSNKIMEFLKRRQANEPGIQNALNANAQAQAQAQAQAHAMMNMQMGRGMGQGPQQGFQPMQHPMQGGQMGQQQQPQQMQMNMGMGMNMGMANQAGRGMGPNQQMMGMPGGPNRPQQASFPQEMARLSPQDKAKVAELAQKMMNTASEQQKANTRMQLSQRLSPQQLAEFQAQGKDPLMWFYQNQAFQVLKASMTRMQQQNSQQGMAQNPNNPQAAMMQQQASQQSLRQQQQGQQQQSQQSQQSQQQQQQQGMMNGGQGGNGFAPFTPNMDGIKDQQMDGLMAQQAGQMVVPASAGPNRNPTPQPMGQNMSNQQGPNQGPRPPQQQQQLQQMKMNQAQQSQAQLQAQAQMKQMQGQPGMGGNMQPAQSPAMNTLNTPVSRPPNNMNPMGNQTVGQGGVQFGDQRFNQGAQRPNNQAFQNMLASLPQEQRATISGLSPDKLNEVMQRWQSRRQEQIGLNAGQGTPGQMANRPQGQMNQMNPNMGGQMPTGMQQPGGPMNGNQQQMSMPRIPQNPQAIAMMDSLDLPPQVLQQLNQVPADIKKWGQLKIWLNQNNIPQQVRSQLAAIQQKQFQLTLQRRSGFMAQQQAQQQQQGQPQQPPQQQTQPQMPQPGQASNANPAMQTPGGAGPGAAMQAMRSQMPPNFPPQLLQVTAQDIAQVRQSRPNLSNVTDEQLRMMVIQMKKQAWIQQQQIRNQQAQVQAQAQAQARAQGQNQAQGQQGAQNQMGVPQAQMQLQQPNQTPQQQNMQAPNGMGQNVTPQGNGQKQPSAAPEQT